MSTMAGSGDGGAYYACSGLDLRWSDAGSRSERRCGPSGGDVDDDEAPDPLPPVADTAFFLTRDRHSGPRDGGNGSDALGPRLRESLRDTALDLYAASQILAIHLVTFESLLCVLVSLGATTAYYVYGRDADRGTTFGANISWMIVSIAVVSPMIMQIKQAFGRRELALQLIGEARALVLNIFMANAIWNWGDDGRARLPEGHVQRTKVLLHRLLTDAAKLLLLPTVTRGRHRFTARGRALALSFAERTQDLQLRIVSTFQRLHLQVEVLKAAGLPANEASRINQYHWLLQARLEKLQHIKFYRTPQATRSFTRLFILILPIFYGPYFVYLMRSDGGYYVNFGFCLTLSVLTSLTMIGLFNVEKAMEDPFVGGGLDGIRLQESLDHLRLVLEHCDQELLAVTNVATNDAVQDMTTKSPVVVVHP